MQLSINFVKSIDMVGYCDNIGRNVKKNEAVNCQILIYENISRPSVRAWFDRERGIFLFNPYDELAGGGRASHNGGIASAHQ